MGRISELPYRSLMFSQQLPLTGVSLMLLALSAVPVAADHSLDCSADTQKLCTELTRAKEQILQLKTELNASQAELTALQAELEAAQAKIQALTTIEQSVEHNDTGEETP